MRIGIDAKWFFKGNPSGKVVVRNLVRELLAADKVNEYFIFLRKEDRGQEFPYQLPNVRLVYIWGGNNLLSNALVTPFYARRYRIDVFLYQYFGPLFKFSKVVTLIHDVIFESHPEYFSFKERLYFRPMRFLARKADRIVTISQNERNRLIRYRYGSAGSIEAVHLGVSDRFRAAELSPSEQERVRKKYGLPPDFVLYVGRLNLRKNIHHLIEAFSHMNGSELKLVLAGSYDWKMFDVPQYINKLGLSEKVHLAGFVDDMDLPVIYQMACIFCFVSYEEGFGLPPLEAMASGTPVVVAHKGSLPEVCGEAGVYVDPDQPEQIAAAIRELERDAGLLARKKEMVLDRSADFTWRQTAEKYLDVFNSVWKERN
ncbi:MAG TPA: glycosyltransferase family 1 protein [Flavisolibacter sp.]|nr:glycosyltransferase family 1 protein [Flavisolibacter sp.]